jgi:hypothetical protein
LDPPALRKRAHVDDIEAELIDQPGDGRFRGLVVPRNRECPNLPQGYM